MVERGAAKRSLADLVSAGRETVADLIGKMPTEDVKPATAIARNGFDRVIIKAIGHIECPALTSSDPLATQSGATPYASAPSRLLLPKPGSWRASRDDDTPTFLEIRSLCKRLYMEQGGIDTKALLGHMSDAIADLYANNRGLEPIKVSINAA